MEQQLNNTAYENILTLGNYKRGEKLFNASNTLKIHNIPLKENETYEHTTQMNLLIHFSFYELLLLTYTNEDLGNLPSKKEVMYQMSRALKTLYSEYVTDDNVEDPLWDILDSVDELLDYSEEKETIRNYCPFSRFMDWIYSFFNHSIQSI